MSKTSTLGLVFSIGEFKESQSWSSGNDKVSILPGIHVLSDKSTSKYQLMGAPFSTKPNAKYSVNFDIFLLKGDMSLGVLDIDTNTWNKQIGLSLGNPGSLKDSFTAQGKNTQIVIQTANMVESVSEAVIKWLRVFES